MAASHVPLRRPRPVWDRTIVGHFTQRCTRPRLRPRTTTIESRGQDIETIAHGIESYRDSRSRFGDLNNDDIWQAGETVPAGNVIVAEVQGVGQFESDDFFCTTAPTLSVRARRGNIVGPFQVMATAAFLDVEVAC